MTEHNEDESRNNRKKRRGNICVRSIVLLGLAIMLVVMLSIVYRSWVGDLGPYYPYSSIISPSDFSIMALIFSIGVVFGYTFRDATIRDSED
ncbi:MAG: hypothetical protein ACFFEK_06025 [Candidatus Thorarchaeota archaeon]